jgi:hypothetical protein
MTQEPAQPRPAPPPDPGLVSWAHIIRKALEAQAGVEITGREGAATSFRYRGQVFNITIAPANK